MISDPPPESVSAEYGPLLKLAMHPSSAVLMRVLGACLSFLVGVIAARVLSVGDFGVLNILLAAVNIGVVVALLGHENLATRAVAVVTATGDVNALHAYRVGAAQNIWRMAFLICVLGAVWFLASGHVGALGGTITAVASACLVLFVARTRYAQGLIRGKHFPGLALVPDGIVKPALTIALILLGVRFVGGHLWAVVVAMAAAAMVALLFGIQAEQNIVGVTRSPLFVSTSSIRSRFSPQMYISSLLAVFGSQMAVLLAGQLAGPEQAGLYGAADRIAAATALVTQSLYLAIAPRIAELHTRGNSDALAALLRKYTRLAVLATGTTALVLGAFSGQVLNLFGAAYVQASGVLAILLISTFLNAAAGPTGMVLLMTKHESLHAWSLSASLACQLLVSLILIPRYGVVGVAVATLCSTVVWNVLMLVAISRRLGLHPVLAWA